MRAKETDSSLVDSLNLRSREKRESQTTTLVVTGADGITRKTKFLFAVVDSGSIEQTTKARQPQPEDGHEDLDDNEEGEDIVAKDDVERHDIVTLTKFVNWFVERGRVISESANLSTSEYVDIVTEMCMKSDSQAYNDRRLTAMARLRELNIEPVYGFLFAQEEEEAATDAGNIAQLDKSINASRPELALRSQDIVTAGSALVRAVGQPQ